MKKQYKRILKKFVKATPNQKEQMYNTLTIETNNLNELLDEMTKHLKGVLDD